MATPKSKAVAKVEETDNELTSAVMPDFMKDDSASGLENLDSSDFIMPIIKLMQATDEDVQTGLVAAGDFYHLTSKVSIGKEVRFIPCHIRKRFMLFRPQDDTSSGSAILARADDGKHWSPPHAAFEVKPKDSKKTVTWMTKPTVAESGLDKFGTSDPEDPQSKPAATLIYDIVAILPDHPELSPVVISLKGSGVTKAKNFFTALKASKAPMYGCVFKAYGSLDKNGKNSYWGYNIRGEGFVKDAGLYEQSKNTFDMCKVQEFVVKDDEPDAADTATGDVSNGKY